MDGDDSMIINLEAASSSDSWGFVGVVSIGDYEAYRTIRSYSTPADALRATQHLLADVLGALLAGQEWRTAADEFGHTPRRTELGLGLKAPEVDTSVPRQPAPRPLE